MPLLMLAVKRILLVLPLLVSGLPARMKAGAVMKWEPDEYPHLADIMTVELDVPIPRSDEVLVQVAGSSVNPCDWKYMDPAYSTKWSFPHALGRDVAGRVVALGSSVSRFKVGDHVWTSNSYDLGGYAQFVAINESLVGLAPSAVPLADAAVLPLVGLTGLEAFRFADAPWDNLSKVVLVLGGSGGTGHVGVQVAKAWGAGKVITTCGTNHVEFCRELGADQVIDYHKQDWHSILQNRSVDFVYDTVALPGTGDKAYDVIKDGGHFVTLLSSGLASDTTVKARPTVKQDLFYMFDQSTYKHMTTLKDLVDARKLIPRIEQTFSIEQITAAFNASMTGHVAGKLSIVPSTGVVVAV